MKPDGVATAALEPMEALESNPGNEAAQVAGQEPDQAASPVGEEIPQQPVAETGQVEPQPEQAKETTAAKTGKKTSGDPKAKTTTKTAAKTKPATTSPTKTTSRPNTAQSRVSNGVSKPQTNGVAKKTTPTLDKKVPPTSASTKKPSGTVGAPAAKSKVAEKKPTSATNGAKTTTGPTAAKKTPSATNGVKTSTTAAAAKKPPAPKPASATPTKPSSAASPKPPVSKTTRPTTGTAASRPATGSTRPPTASTTKSSTATAKPATPKTPSTTAKPAASKPTSTTPSGGKPSATQTSRNSTPVKKDVTKPAAKKPAESPLSRPSSTTKSAKPETPKSASKSEVTAKKPTTTKAADTKTPSRPKTQESKSTPSKDAAKTPTSKTAKSSAPKKTVGSSTPTPVKRGPKAAPAEESVKEIAAAVATAAAIATAAAAIARPEEPEPPAEVAVEPPVASIEAVKTEEPTPEPASAPVLEPTPEPIREPTPEPIREPTPEPIREPTPEPVREPTPEPIREPTPEPIREPTPEPIREPTPEPVREPTPEPIREPTPEPPREPTPEPVREPTPEPLREPTPEPAWEPTPEPVREPSPVQALSPELPVEVSSVPLSAQLDPFRFEDSAENSVPCLGTTVMSPPCSPPGPVSPVREAQNASPLMDMHIQSNPWDRNQPLSSADADNMMNFQTEEEKENKEHFEAQEREEEEEEEEEEEKENLFMSTSTAPSAEAFNVMAQPHFLGASPMDDFISRDLMSPHEKEEAVEKADEEINEDDDDEGDYEDEEQRRLGHQPSSLITDMSMSQPSEEFHMRPSALGGSAGWHGDDLLSGMDSEDVSSCTSSRQQGVSDLSSTQHTAILEGTQSSDALVDSSLRGSEGDCNLMSSPNVETLANEEEDDDDEEERVDDMDLSSERVEEHHKVFQQQEHYEEEDEDVEMHSEGVTESCENADEDDFNEEERLDNLNRSAPAPCMPPTSSWGQTNPFSDTWGQPASLLAVSSPSPVSDHGAAESETPTQSPAQACLDSSAPSFAPQSEQEPQQHDEMKGSAPEEAHVLLAAPAVGMSQFSSGAGLAAHSSSETSTPEELRDYDSSSGVESRSDKQQTPVPTSVQPDMEQDLGIHLEKGDGEEEEAETLPADEVLGTGPPTAPASVPSSPTTSGDEASDTEGEMQINDPDAPMMMGESAGFDSPTATCNLPALDEDEEAGDAHAVEGEEDGGGATPQSANSVASYGFDCTTSNSNAHSMAESCGKSPGIFSLENEEQLPEEAKDPSLIKELTLPSAAATAAQAEDLLGRPVDLMPLGLVGDIQPRLDEHHYMLGGKVSGDHLGQVDPLEPGHHLGAQESEDTGDSQPPYYSAICDKTDSFLAGDENRDEEVDGGLKLQSYSQEDNQNQNYSTTDPIANGHYLALVPGNRRPIDPALAEHFSKIVPPPRVIESSAGGEQLRRLEQHQLKLMEMQHRQEQERQKRQWLEEERVRLEQQKQLEQQRRELLQLQLQQQQHEHRQRRQVQQWQLELEQQYRMQQKQIQQQQQLRRSPTGVMLSPSSGLCTIYEAMETSDEEDELRGEEEQNRNKQAGGKKAQCSQSDTQDFHRQPRPAPPQDLEWNKKVDMVQQLINQTLMLSGDGGCPPLLLLPVGTGGTLSPLESSMWPNMLPQFSPPSATVTSVSSYSPDSRGSSPSGDWTVVEVETQH